MKVIEECWWRWYEGYQATSETLLKFGDSLKWQKTWNQQLKYDGHQNKKNKPNIDFKNMCLM